VLYRSWEDVVEELVTEKDPQTAVVTAARVATTRAATRMTQVLRDFCRLEAVFIILDTKVMRI
jgi:hypothetical protein